MAIPRLEGLGRRATLQRERQTGDHENHPITCARDGLIEQSLFIAKASAELGRGHDAETDFVRHENNRTGAPANLRDEAPGLRVYVAASLDQVEQPEGQAIDDNEVRRSTRPPKRADEIERFLDKPPSIVTVATVPIDPRDHLGVSRARSRDHDGRAARRIRQRLGVTALAGARAAEDQNGFFGHGIFRHARDRLSGRFATVILIGFAVFRDSRMNRLFANLPTTIFEVMSSLAREKQAVNLGQGFPDDPGPEDVRRKAADAVLNGYNQYPSMMGLPELRGAIAEHYGRFQGVKIDAATETMVTSGATEAIAGAILATVEPGDEVVLFQPTYDAYLPLVERAGGVARFVTLRPPRWTFTEADLDAVFNERTRAVIFNNPLNPSGIVYERAQVELLARYCARFNAIAICDEVWEHVIFDGRPHVSMLSIPSMRERTIKIGSAGKIFSLTGWKVGLVVAAPDIMRVIAKSHQFLTFTTPPNLQVAVAYGLGKEEDYFAGMRAGFQRSRDRFCEGLVACGFPVIPSDGTYFVNVDIGAIGETDDVAFCRRLVEEHGVAAIPVSAFYAENHVRTVVRFCFAKNDATLDAGLERLRGAIRR